MYVQLRSRVWCLFAPLGIPNAAHLPRSPIQLNERIRTDGQIVSIPRIMAITVNVCFQGQTIMITTAFRFEVLD